MAKINPESKSITFLATLPPILSAIKISGDGGMRIQFDVPESEMENAIGLLAWRERVLKITIEVETEGEAFRALLTGMVSEPRLAS